MATLREIRKKLHSIQNVKKITQAMEMVAGARIRKVQARSEKARPYLEELKLILNNLMKAADGLSHPLATPRDVKRIAVVLVAADKGLCGAYNNNIFFQANSFLQKFDPKNVDLYLVGQKTVAHFDKKRWPVEYRLVNWAESITFETLDSLSNKLIESFLTASVDEVWIIYTRFQNIMNRHVTEERLLPVPLPAVERESFNENYIFEPNEHEIFAALLPRYCWSKIQLALHDSLTSELAARILAMRAATKNADEITNELTLESNKLRQAGITGELLEITSGAEASKSLF